MRRQPQNRNFELIAGIIAHCICDTPDLEQSTFIDYLQRALKWRKDPYQNIVIFKI